MKGPLDAIVQQKGGASPVVNQFTADTILPEGLKPEQLVDLAAATVIQPSPAQASGGPSGAGDHLLVFTPLWAYSILVV